MDFDPTHPGVPVEWHEFPVADAQAMLGLSTAIPGVGVDFGWKVYS